MGRIRICTNIVHKNAMSDWSFTVKALASPDCRHAAEDKIYLSLWEFHHVFILPFPNRKRRVVRSLGKIKNIKHTHKQLESKMADLLILDSMSKGSWGNITFAVFYSAQYITPWDSSKNWEVWELQNRKRLRQSMSTFGFLFSGYMSKSPS